MTDDANGPVALVGSGEFLPAMREVDDMLLDGRPRRVAVVPTAAGTEGDRSVRRWFDLAHRHYESLGAEVVEVDVRDAAAASRWSGDLADVGMVYLSGGRPAHLVGSLAGTPVLEAVLAAWRAGAALAGCSAGAMALATSLVAAPWRSAETWTDAFGVVPGIGVLPHFDRYARGAGAAVTRFSVRPPHGLRVLGVDEDTALVHVDGDWSIRGRGSAWEVRDDAVAALDPATVPAPGS